MFGGCTKAGPAADASSMSVTRVTRVDHLVMGSGNSGITVAAAVGGMRSMTTSGGSTSDSGSAAFNFGVGFGVGTGESSGFIGGVTGGEGSDAVGGVRIRRRRQTAATMKRQQASAAITTRMMMRIGKEEDDELAGLIGCSALPVLPVAPSIETSGTKVESRYAPTPDVLSSLEGEASCSMNLAPISAGASSSDFNAAPALVSGSTTMLTTPFAVMGERINLEEEICNELAIDSRSRSENSGESIERGRLPLPVSTRRNVMVAAGRGGRGDAVEPSFRVPVPRLFEPVEDTRTIANDAVDELF